MKPCYCSFFVFQSSNSDIAYGTKINKKTKGVLKISKWGDLLDWYCNNLPKFWVFGSKFTDVW